MFPRHARIESAGFGLALFFACPVEYMRSKIMESGNNNYKQSLFYLLAAILVFAPLFRAGNSPIPLMLLEWGALAVFALVALDTHGLRQISTTQVVAVMSILLLPILFLLPIPQDLWVLLPGRGQYLDVLNASSTDSAEYWRSVSIISNTTEIAFWALLPPIIVYIAAMNQHRHNLQRLVYVVIGMGIFQAALGLMQTGQGVDSVLYLGNEYAGGSASGTYLNRDHFSGFLEMLFPVVLALLAATVGRKGKQRRRTSRWRDRLDFLSSMRGHQAVVYGLIAILMLLAIIFTKSRMGIALAMLGLLFVFFAFFRRLGGNNVYGAYGSVMAAVVILAVEIGLAPVLDRFSADPMEDLRWTIFSSSLQGVQNFLPLGSGPGTYPGVYPAFPPIALDAFINRAHNDYLEWIFDAGLAVVVLLAGFMFLYLHNWKKLWISAKWRTFRFIQVGAGIGIALLLLHSFVDFNLHKPANAIYFAFFLAIFMKPNNEELEDKRNIPRRSKTRRMPPQPVEVKQVVSGPTPGAPDLSDW